MILNSRQNAKLLVALDRIKDQTFFLSQISQESLKNTMFPVGSFTKDVVKKIAIEIGLDKIANKKESMGICFVGKRKSGFQKFLQEYTEVKPGPILDIETWKNVGEHPGAHFWTLGQKAKISGLKDCKYYVCDKDLKTNTLFVCNGGEHPALYSENFFTLSPYWIDRAPDELSNRSKDQVIRGGASEASGALSYSALVRCNWGKIASEASH